MGGVISRSDNDQFLESLRNQFPLISQLRFSTIDGEQCEELPPIISLISSMTNPDLEGDSCILLPSRKNISFLVAVISALAANSEHYPDRLQKYISEGFEYGDHVRVLPDGHVYSFAGYFNEEKYGKFFKLNFLNNQHNSSRAFPIKRAVRLEKTNASTPKGTGQEWGKAYPSKLDLILGTETYGNHCLFSNEIMLVATKKEFLEFLDSVYVSRPGNDAFSVLLRDLIPWGVVKPDGSIDFEGNAAATGQPIIAVSPRLEYIAAACRANQDISPRVIIDGASRVKDLQAFDDVVDYSKLLVVADHSQVYQLDELESRGCIVWRLPYRLEGVIGSGSTILDEFQTKHRRAAHFNLVSLPCKSGPVEAIASSLMEAEKALREEEADEPAFKIVSIAYARLLDLSAILHTPSEGEFGEIRESVDKATKLLHQQRSWISQNAYGLLSEALEGIMRGISPQSGDYRFSKQVRLLEEVKKLSKGKENFAIVCYSSVAAQSARAFLSENELEEISVRAIPEYLQGEPISEIILTGWPRSINFYRLADCYNSEKISCLSFGFEHRWFSGASTRRGRTLSKWKGNVDLFRALTGLRSNISIDPELPPEVSEENDQLFDQVENMEKTVSRIRKGLNADAVDYADSREAKYIGFEGMAYSYLSRGRKIPNVTNLVSSHGQGNEKDTLAAIGDLKVGDYVLWRANSDSDKDMVRLIAEQGMPMGEYEAYRKQASRWKSCLQTLDKTYSGILEKLKDAGFTKTEATVKNWLFNEDNIGPGEIEDLHIIARAARQSDFIKSIPEVWSAISKIRSAHVAAGFKLSQLLFRNLPGQLPELINTETFVDLSLDDISIGGVWILQVELIAEEFEMRPYWDVNRLLWDEI